jgi:hypothetical protein
MPEKKSFLVFEDDRHWYEKLRYILELFDYEVEVISKIESRSKL